MRSCEQRIGRNSNYGTDEYRAWKHAGQRDVVMTGRKPPETQVKKTPPPPLRGRAGYVAARTVGSLVPGLTKKAFEKHGFSAAALITDWATIVGHELAAATSPDKLKWPKGIAAYEEVEGGAAGRPGATLIVRVDPARALDVQYQTRQLMERINAYFGYRAVTGVRLLQAPLDVAPNKPVPRAPAPVAPAASKAVANVKDEALKSSLERLGSSIFRSKGRRKP
jgi:hypothetical protein